MAWQRQVFETYTSDWSPRSFSYITLAGSTESLDHSLDVVPTPLETLNQWVHPPFSGYFDGSQPICLHIQRLRLTVKIGEFIWGRGSCDDKSGLIASM